MTARLEISLLGPVTLRRDGAEVPLASVPQRVVLARLALSAGRLASPAALFEALWPDEPPRNATGNLHTYVSRLRQVLGSDRIVREPGGYRLAGDVSLDIDRVSELLAAARRPDEPDPAGRLGAALALWRGEPLSDLPDPAAFAPDLARLAAWRRQLESEWFTARLAAGGAAEALPDLERAAAADPLREDVQVLLATALYQVGRGADALSAVAAYRRRLADEHGLDPGPLLSELAGRLLREDPTLRPPASRRRTFAPGDRFVGRGDELAATEAALAAHRAVTLVGPGGVGKTRLSLELVDRLGGPGPVTVVELHQVSRPDDVAVAVATAVGLQGSTGAVQRPVEAVADLIGSSPTLLVLDNCEHVRPAARDVAAELLARCPELRVLATSRQRLSLAGEKVLRLGPLPGADQVELFCDRAALLRDDFAATASVRAVAAQICATLDGLPLAVELAASREAVFGVTQLLERLTLGLEVLEPVRDADRASAVTATVEWSYRLLDPDAQLLFDRLSVCQGLPLEAVGYFASGPAALAELVEASLVVRDGDRYRLLETMRRVGNSHLDVGGVRAAQEMRVAWMTAYADRFHALQHSRAPSAAGVLQAELVNLRDVLGWTVDSGCWAAAGRLGATVAFGLIDHPELGLIAQLARLAGVPDDVEPAVRGRCLLAAGAAYWLQGDVRTAERVLTEAFELVPDDDPQRWVARYFLVVTHMFAGAPDAVHADARALVADPATPRGAAAGALCCSVLTHIFTGQLSAAESLLASEADLVGQIEDRDGIVAYTRGELAAASDPARALAEFTRSYELSDGQGHRYMREVALIGRTAVLIRLGRSAEAASSCRRSLSSLRSSGMWPQLWTMLRLSAELLVSSGSAEVAAVLLAAGERDPLAPAVHPPEQRRHDELWSVIAAGLGVDGVAAARAAAARIDRPGAVDQAIKALASVE
ncbi:BTAD domain-containing putative transcriptional regulator [Asanoa sp. WMMD1127]|uniref:BTAD domain-containing putative transcriptional regulator n=1 Tax=Asanoa sp. WMMD1127 TaxID=3016107 RepID=UPI002416C521|nr:BTAD domain-containing putative transcriptional regulator [Asanoa sp. WMMD1127]MDG4823266.1 BTAD domain-containing putative transcriptional regulator [Asanoa sp. WMMD1127]